MNPDLIFALVLGSAPIITLVLVVLYINGIWPFCDHHWCKETRELVRKNPCGEGDFIWYTECCWCHKKVPSYHYEH